MKARCVGEARPVRELVARELPVPVPGAGEVLIRVHAAGVTPTELQWYPTTHDRMGGPRQQAVPGHEFSGRVAACGGGGDFKVGQEVYGFNDWFADGATAEYCLATPASIAPKPRSLTHVEAATVPIGALTAWQGLFTRANVQPGERVLIHGGAGAVGLFAVQLAHRAGAQVATTASSRHRGLLRELGAETVIDYQTEKFEEQAGLVDVVFDAVGGDTLRRSWAVLKPGGRLVTIAADGEGTADERTKAAFFIVAPDQKQLQEVARLIDRGELKIFVGGVVPLAQAGAAYLGTLGKRTAPGKLVVAVV